MRERKIKLQVAESWVGPGNEANFPPLSPQISSEFRQLRPVFQEVIADIAKRMGSGMTVFLQEKVGSMAQWDEVGTETISV